MSNPLARSLCDNQTNTPTEPNYLLNSKQILIEDGKFIFLLHMWQERMENQKNNAEHFHLKRCSTGERACMKKLSLVQEIKKHDYYITSLCHKFSRLSLLLQGLCVMN